MHHRLIRGQSEQQHVPIRRAVRRWVTSASLLSAGVIAAAMIAVPAQASAQGGLATGPKLALPGAGTPFQESLRYGKAFRSLLIPASERGLGTTAGSGGSSYGNDLGNSEALSANGKVAVVGAPEGGVGGVAYVYVEGAGSWKRVQTLQATPQVPGGLFGWQVALSSTGSTLMVSGTVANGDPAVSIYTRSKGGAWTQSSKIAVSIAQPGVYWGQSVAMSDSGTEILVGAQYAYNDAGAAYLYKKTAGGTWHLTATWHPSSGSNSAFFGITVALSGLGTTALVTGANIASQKDVVNVYQASAGSWKRTSELTRPVADEFGTSLALSADGSTAVIGAWGTNNSEGAAYVFDHTNDSWSLGGTLSAPDGAAGDQFGTSVALSQSGTAALVGAPAGAGTDGAAYVFTGPAGSWSEQAELTASGGQAGDEFGNAVALSSSGSTAAIGTPNADGSRGAAYVFQGPDGSWAQQTELTQGGENASDQFGASVGISASGDTAVVGALGNNNSAGAVYVFTHRHGRWGRSATLTTSDPQQNDGFGEAVAISGDGSTIAVEGGNYGTTSAKPSVYIFDRTSTGWSQSAEPAPPAKEAGVNFGWNFSLSGDGSNLAVGTLGGARAWYFTRQQDGSWKLAQQFSGPGGTGFGLDVALSSDASTLFIGESAATASSGGAVLVYTQSDGKWKQSARLMANAKSNNAFGQEIAVSANGSRAVIAAPRVNDFQGAMYVFSRNAKGRWRQVSELQASDGEPGDELGFNSFCGCTIGLTANGTTAVIGAELKADYAGAAYAFSASPTKSWSQAAEFTSSPNSGDQMGFSDDISANGFRNRGRSTRHRQLVGRCLHLHPRIDGMDACADPRRSGNWRLAAQQPSAAGGASSLPGRTTCARPEPATTAPPALAPPTDTKPSDRKGTPAHASSHHRPGRARRARRDRQRLPGAGRPGQPPAIHGEATIDDRAA